MTTTPLPPAIEPVAWFEYARKKPTLKRLVFDRTSRSQLRVAGWVSEPLVKESDATQARADLVAENKRLREALEAILDEQNDNEGYAKPATYDAAYAALEFVARHKSSDWPERCQQMVDMARAVLKEQP